MDFFHRSENIKVMSVCSSDIVSKTIAVYLPNKPASHMARLLQNRQSHRLSPRASWVAYSPYFFVCRRSRTWLRARDPNTFIRCTIVRGCLFPTIHCCRDISICPAKVNAGVIGKTLNGCPLWFIPDSAKFIGDTTSIFSGVLLEDLLAGLRVKCQRNVPKGCANVFHTFFLCTYILEKRYAKSKRQHN